MLLNKETKPNQTNQKVIFQGDTPLPLFCIPRKFK